MKLVRGDLLELAEAGEFDVIIHGCNCFNVMGAGIAKQIADRYPKAYDADNATPKGAIQKLGCFTYAPTDTFLIVNAYTQYSTATSGEDVFEYDSFRVILRKLAHEFGASRFGLPLIGTGLAGGDKGKILMIIEEFSKQVEKSGGSVTLVEWKKAND